MDRDNCLGLLADQEIVREEKPELLGVRVRFDPDKTTNFIEQDFMKGITIILIAGGVAVLLFVILKGVKVRHELNVAGFGGSNAIGEAIRGNTKIQTGFNEILEGLFGGDWRVMW